MWANHSDVQIAWAHVCEQRDKMSEVAWAMIHTAWLSDDLGEGLKAIGARRKAVDLIRALHREDKVLRDSMRGADELILIDLLRRSRDFRQAEHEAWDAIKSSPAPLMAQALLFELLLISDQDSGAHNMEEVCGEDELSKPEDTKDSALELSEFLRGPGQTRLVDHVVNGIRRVYGRT